MKDLNHDERFVTHRALLLGASVVLIGIAVYAFRKKSGTPLPQVEIDRLAALIDM